MSPLKKYHKRKTSVNYSSHVDVDTLNRKKFQVRHANYDDIDGIIDVELNRYHVLYMTFPEKKHRLNQMFRERIDNSKGWFWVLTDSKKILGFISAQPTTKGPEDFKSWETSTDSGTLESTFDPSGNNVYVVNLDVLREATKLGGQYMLMATLGSKILSEGKELIFFESRMPEFKAWVTGEKNIPYTEWKFFNEEEQHQYASEYSSLTIHKNGKELPADRLLRFYEDAGFKQYKLVANAFHDIESLDYGVVFYAKNPIPGLLRVYPVNKLGGLFLRLVGKNPRILGMFVR